MHQCPARDLILAIEVEKFAVRVVGAPALIELHRKAERCDLPFSHCQVEGGQALVVLGVGVRALTQQDLGNLVRFCVASEVHEDDMQRSVAVNIFEHGKRVFVDGV